MNSMQHIIEFVKSSHSLDNIFSNTDFCLQRVIILYEMRCGSLALVLGDYKMSEIRTSSYVWPQIHMRTLLIGLLTCMNLQATFDYMGQQGKFR